MQNASTNSTVSNETLNLHFEFGISISQTLIRGKNNRHFYFDTSVQISKHVLLPTRNKIHLLSNIYFLKTVSAQSVSLK